MCNNWEEHGGVEQIEQDMVIVNVELLKLLKGDTRTYKKIWQ